MMTPDDILYAVLLILCVICGSFVRKVEDVTRKKIICSSIGFTMLAVISGYHVLHLLVLTVVNAVIVLNINKNICHIVSFFFCFFYLIFTRLSEYIGLPSLPEVTNAALMIMVLKMVGLAFELNIQHLESNSLSSEKSYPKALYTKINPSFFDVLQYSFCYAGILVGPYYKYCTYNDMFHKPYSMYVPHFDFLKKRIAVVPLYMVLYLISDYFFPLSIAVSEEIWRLSFTYRLLYMMAWFFSFRMRLYIAFVLGECICINVGLGAYPKNCSSKPGAGPTNFAALHEIEKNPGSHKVLNYDFASVRSMDEFTCEFGPTMHQGIRYWNMTVQYWLAMYIYKKTAASKSVKVFTTMLVSAIWHGIHSGYYLSLLGTSFMLVAETKMESTFHKNLSVSAQNLYHFIWYFVKMFLLSYMGIAFIILDPKAIINFWNSIYYVGHFFILFMFVAVSLKYQFTKEIHTGKKE